MKLKIFYESLYRQGIAMVSGPIRMQREKDRDDLWNMIVGIARDEFAKLLNLSLWPGISKNGREEIISLGEYAYRICLLSQEKGEIDITELSEKITEAPIAKTAENIIMAHGFLAGLLPLRNLLSGHLLTLWFRLLGKSPLSQIIELPALENFPASWSWDFLAILRSEKIFATLLQNQLLSITPSIRKELGELFSDWIERKEDREFVLDVYWRYKCWRKQLNCSPLFGEMLRDLQGGKAFVEEGWREFFRPLMNLVAKDKYTDVNERVLREFPGDFIYDMQILTRRSEKFPGERQGVFRGQST